MFSEDIEHTSYLHPDPNEFYPYTPVDPFRPSLAYSVQNVPDLEDVIDQLNLNAYSAPNFRPKIGRGLEQGFRELQRVTSDAGLSGPRTALGEDPLPYMRASHGEFPSEPPPHRRERTSSMRSNRSQTRGDEDDGFPRHRGSPLPDLRSTNSVKSKNSGNSLKGLVQT
ncbi:hypothetical protein B0H34DRAFT_273757 [Crassisporium funariophilum]|nr:hypothetical protein B0H34DRAFT_273757 [Crassisporium funariophilum]